MEDDLDDNDYHFQRDAGGARRCRGDALPRADQGLGLSEGHGRLPGQSADPAERAEEDLSDSGDQTGGWKLTLELNLDFLVLEGGGEVTDSLF